MNQITQFLTSYGALILFATAFSEQSGVPLPAAPWLLGAGALAAAGHMNLFAAICWTALGSLAADTAWFCVGYRGKGRVLSLISNFVPIQPASESKRPTCSIARALRILTAAKFLPFGTIVPLRAGALNVRLARFVVVDAFSSLFYASVYVLLGFFFHRQLEQVLALIKRLGLFALVLLAVALAVYLSRKFLKQRRLKLNEAMPAIPKLEETHV